MSKNKSALERGFDALNTLIAEGAKITMNSVAKRAEFNHANFRYPEFADLKDTIAAAQKQQQGTKLSNEVEVLKKQIADLTAKLKDAQKQVKELAGNKVQEPVELIVKLTECYRLNDQLKSENADLKNQLAHKIGQIEEVLNFDTETGEIIGIFDR